MAPMVLVFAVLSLLLPACIAQLTCSPRGGKTWCCPQKGPNSLYLQLQQSNAYEVLCNYGRGPLFTQCAYNASTGATIPTPSSEIGCPRSAIKDPFGAALCPLTNGIHPNFNSKKCVEVQRYADGAKVDVHDCTGANNEKFVFNRGTYTLIQAAGTNFCLDAGPDPEIATKVTVKICDVASPTQRWYYTAFNTFIFDGTALVIQKVGNDLELRPFAFDDQNQIWSTFP